MMGLNVWRTVEFFFFKQKTAYEMRISDWSSDVCSSDLIGMAQARRLDLDQHLAPSGPVDLDVLDLECSGDPVEYRSLHGASPLIGYWMARMGAYQEGCMASIEASSSRDRKSVAQGTGV